MSLSDINVGRKGFKNLEVDAYFTLCTTNSWSEGLHWNAFITEVNEESDFSCPFLILNQPGAKI